MDFAYGFWKAIMNTTGVQNLKTFFYNINKYYSLPLIILGTIGNSITFYIYSRKEFQKTSTAFYFAYSTIIDTLCLFFGSLKRFLEGLNEREIRNSSNLVCKLTIYMNYSLVHISSWILVLISFDRLISSRIFSREFQKRKNQIIAIALLSILIFVSNIYLPIKVGLIEIGNQTYCDYKNMNTSFIISIYDLLVSVLVPFLIIAVTNFLIAFKLYKSKLKILDIKQSYKITRVYAFTIIGKNLLFLILNLPLCVVILYAHIFRHDFDTSYEIWAHNVLYGFFYVLNDLNYAVNAILHFSINPNYRKYFISKLKNVVKKFKVDRFDCHC